MPAPRMQASISGVRPLSSDPALTQPAGPSFLSIFPSSDAFIATINLLITRSSSFFAPRRKAPLHRRRRFQFDCSFGLGEPAPVAIRFLKLPRKYKPARRYRRFSVPTLEPDPHG